MPVLVVGFPGATISTVVHIVMEEVVFEELRAKRRKLETELEQLKRRYSLTLRKERKKAEIQRELLGKKIRICQKEWGMLKKRVTHVKKQEIALDLEKGVMEMSARIKHLEASNKEINRRRDSVRTSMGASVSSH